MLAFLSRFDTMEVWLSRLFLKEFSFQKVNKKSSSRMFKVRFLSTVKHLPNSQGRVQGPSLTGREKSSQCHSVLRSFFQRNLGYLFTLTLKSKKRTGTHLLVRRLAVQLFTKNMDILEVTRKNVKKNGTYGGAQ